MFGGIFLNRIGEARIMVYDNFEYPYRSWLGSHAPTVWHDKIQMNLDPMGDLIGLSDEILADTVEIVKWFPTRIIE